MVDRRLRYALDVLLLLAAVAVFLSGLLVDRLDLNDFAPHRWAGYTLAALVAVHVGLHWGFFVHPRPAGRSRPPAAVAPGSSDSPAPAAGAPTVATAPSAPSRRAALVGLGAGAAGLAGGWFARAEVSPRPYDGGDVGIFYHRESSLGVRGLLSDVLRWGRRPAPYARVGEAEPVALPAAAEPDLSLADALRRRRSLRAYADRAMTGDELAWLVAGATGITSGAGYRTAPSAGALYPIETYVAVRRVTGVDEGLYHVDVRAQALEPVRTGSVAGDVMLAGLGQDFLRAAPAVVVLTGLFQRTRWKYHERHYRYVCWEGGHVAQNIYLAAEAAGLGACMVGAFLDGYLNDLLRVDGRTEAALGLIAVGPR